MKQKVYYILVFALCIISVAFAIMDFTTGLSHTQKITDQIIYWFFVGDYVIRLVVSDSKKNFAKDNIFDLLAIIPFNSAFRAFRLLRMVKVLRLSKVLKFTKLFRVGSLSGRLLSKSKRFFNTNGFKYVLLLSASSVLLASFAMMYFEGMKFTDALWWSFVTATTVGYGDLPPSTATGRIIAALLMLIGIGLIGSLTSTITSFFLRPEKEEIDDDKVAMVKAMYDILSNQEKNQFIKIIREDKGYEDRSKKIKHQEICKGQDNWQVKEASKEHSESTVWKEGNGFD